VATVRPLSFDEASSCSLVLTSIKLSFVYGVGPDDFDQLPPREKAAVNLVGDKRYMEPGFAPPNERLCRRR
jgi:hypothetical protein